MLLFAGDPHGYFDPINRAAAQEEPDAVVLLGDYDLPAPMDQVLGDWAQKTQLAWIQGNHDADRDYWYDHLYETDFSPGCIDGRVVTLGSQRVAGLGGVFRTEIWHPESGVNYRSHNEYRMSIAPRKRWRGGVPRKHRASIWWEDYERLFDQRADILVCHEAPSSHRHGFQVFDDLAQSMGVKLIVHGHHHEDYDAELPSGIRVMGVGLSGVRDESGRIHCPGIYSDGRRPREKS